MQRLLTIIGGIAILATFFLGTLSILDSWDLRSMDAVRIEHAKSLKAALERYRAAHAKYPAPFVDSDIGDLKAALVGGGFIDKLPVDPYWKNGRINKYRYRSDGVSYSLLFYLELGPCLTGVGPYLTAPWNGRTIPVCAF